MKINRQITWSTLAGLAVFLGFRAPVAAQSKTPFAIGWDYPANHQSFTAPANVPVQAWVTDTAIVRTVEYFAGTNVLGITTNTPGLRFTNPAQSNPFFFTWPNVAAGTYALTAVAVDSAGQSATSSVVNITVTNAVIRPSVAIESPQNGAHFTGPGNLTLIASATEKLGGIANVAFFAGTNNLGVAALVPPATSGSALPLYTLVWTNPAAANYALTAVATDTNSFAATSAVVNLTVTTRPPPPPIPYTVQLASPFANETFPAGATVPLAASVTDSNQIASVQFFANTQSLGTVSNLVPQLGFSGYLLNWTNVPAGNFVLTAVALDSGGLSATSAPVTVSVVGKITPPPPPPVPFVVALGQPNNGQSLLAPANVALKAVVTDSNAVQAVTFFANGAAIGQVTNSPTAAAYSLVWSNVAVGAYSLSAVALDSAGHSATSAPVSLNVVSNLLPVLSIFAPDPIAVAGTNLLGWFTPPGGLTNYLGGTNTATFLVHREGGTNSDFTASYSIGGTASNGVDYVTIPGAVTLPAGKSFGLVTISPLVNTNSLKASLTVVLTLTPPATNAPATYTLGRPAMAGALILEPANLPTGGTNTGVHHLRDGSRYVTLPGTNGLNYCLQISTNLLTWQSICTNTVLKGAAQFVDPPGLTNGPGIYYRAVPMTGPASY